MTENLQQIVEDLAVRLGRPVLLEDHGQRVVAYSEQTEPMDDIRRDSILRRQTTQDVRRRFRSAGIFESAGPLRIPGESGVLARVCVPARHRDRLLGFLWLIDAGPPMSDEDIAMAAKAAPRLALTLLHESLAAGLTVRREQEALTGVLLGDHDRARTGARLLIEEGGFPQADPVTALVIRPVAEPDRTHLEQGLLAARVRLAGRHPLHLVRYDHGVLLCAGRVPDPADVHAAVPMPVVVGIGRTRSYLADAAGSYREARHAATVAAMVPGHGPSAAWETLGVYRMLAEIPPGELHPGLERLMADPQHRPLLETLETYLDLAGNVADTAKQLRLHRTSLYYRLQRLESLAETNLRSGEERLTLHLSLKLARLSGRWR